MLAKPVSSSAALQHEVWACELNTCTQKNPRSQNSGTRGFAPERCSTESLDVASQMTQTWSEGPWRSPEEARSAEINRPSIGD